MATPPDKTGVKTSSGQRATHAWLKTAKGRSNASQRWLARQINEIGRAHV